MKKCKEKVDQVRSHNRKVMSTTMTNDRHSVIVKCSKSSNIVIISVLSAFVCLLSVIATQHGVGAQLAQPIQQISAASAPVLNDHQGLRQHGGNLYAPQHGYDNNIEFIHDQTETIYEVPSQLDSNNDHREDPSNPEDHHQHDLDTLPNEGQISDFQTIGAGDTYLHNGAPELETDSDLHHRLHLDDDESVNANQLPDDDDRGEVNSEFTELDGGIIVGQKILRQTQSPYVLNTDLEVEKGGVLTIEPGVTIEFAPMVGITVRGVINAVVSDMMGNRINARVIGLWTRGMMWKWGLLSYHLFSGGLVFVG